jgi:hypothetical protein
MESDIYGAGSHRSRIIEESLEEFRKFHSDFEEPERIIFTSIPDAANYDWVSDTLFFNHHLGRKSFDKPLVLHEFEHVELSNVLNGKLSQDESTAISLLENQYESFDQFKTELGRSDGSAISECDNDGFAAKNNYNILAAMYLFNQEYFDTEDVKHIFNDEYPDEAARTLIDYNGLKDEVPGLKSLRERDSRFTEPRNEGLIEAPAFMVMMAHTGTLHSLETDESTFENRNDYYRGPIAHWTGRAENVRKNYGVRSVYRLEELTEKFLNRYHEDRDLGECLGSIIEEEYQIMANKISS